MEAKNGPPQILDKKPSLAQVESTLDMPKALASLLEKAFTQQRNSIIFDSTTKKLGYLARKTDHSRVPTKMATNSCFS